MPASQDKLHIRKSKNGPRRAAALILVNLLMITHLVLWLGSGRRATLSPVEPSETMYTINDGLINAGCIFFSLAILSTLVFGRWFCGWGCHIVALQDFCAWIMKKCGVRPKPFRSRLLILAPLILALYMFVWPTLRREVIKPAAGQNWAQIAPYLGEAGPRPHFQLALTKQSFWETFANWYVAIPFLLVCGFGTVYFLGAKGFCTYGCPYGGFFAPLDKLAPGRILVTDACEHCGHCTSVCTSNVRVHEEVRDFGMVVDPGCMKCLDCVSVCPNDALYFGFAKPAVFGARRATPTARAESADSHLPPTRFKQRVYDLPLYGEVILFALGFALFFAFRGMPIWPGSYDTMPLLMAMGLAAIGIFLAWKLWQLAREPNVRLQSLQLKLKGRIKAAGAATGVLAALLLSLGAWGFVVQFALWRGDTLDAATTIPLNVALSPGFQADSSQRDLAQRALYWYNLGASPSLGGWGWADNIPSNTRASYLNILAGNPAESERRLLRAIEIGLSLRHAPVSSDQLICLNALMHNRAATLSEMITRVSDIAARSPENIPSHSILGDLYLEAGQQDKGLEQAGVLIRMSPPDALYEGARLYVRGGRSDLAVDPLRTAVAAMPGAAEPHLLLAHAWVDLNHPQDALTETRAAVQIAPNYPHAHFALAAALADTNHLNEALTELQTAIMLDPHNAAYMQMAAEILEALGRNSEASEMANRANQARRGG